MQMSRNGALTISAFAVVITLLACATRPATASPTRCPRYRYVVVKNTSHNSAGLAYAVNTFRAALGGDDNGNTVGPLNYGHRSINWDAPIVPFNMPANFFNSPPTTRGAVFQASPPKFAVSNPSGGWSKDDKFSSLNERASRSFITFSPKRLFTPVHTNTVTTKFRIPGKYTPAAVAGFGAVFVDVDKPYTTYLKLYDYRGCLVANVPVPPKSGGLSFVGVKINKVYYPWNPARGWKAAASPIAKATMKLGNASIKSRAYWTSTYAWWKKMIDVVVLDDLIYGEPRVLQSY